MALRLYLDAASTASKLVVGLYANSRVENDPDDEAGALLGTATLLNPRPGGWNEVRLPEPVPIVAGATYWFALLNPHDATGRLIWHDRASEPYGLERTSQSLTLTALPPNRLIGLAYSNGGPVSGAAYGVPPGVRVTPPATATATPAPESSPPPSMPATPQPPAKPRPLPRLRAPSKLRMGRGVISIRVTCPRSCRLTATLSRGGRTLGKASKRGRKLTLRVHLTAHGRKLVRAHKRLTLRLTRRIGTKTQTVKRSYAVSSAAPSSRATKAA
jgi:hypothetical protein